jgi:hypothetical protein
MTDFASAFQRGQRAAEDAARARAEVASVLESLRQQVSEATNGVIEITVGRDTLSALTEIARAFSNSDQAEFATKAILARNLAASNQPGATLGRFNMPVEGFPCVVTFGRQEERCHDGEALEKAFEEMLQDAAVGRALHRLLAEPIGESPSTERLETRVQGDDTSVDGS